MEPQKRVKQSWSLKLGLIQAVVLLGVVTGSMLCAFYLGLVSGQKAGFESAQTINLASVAKLPIPEQYRNEDLDSVASKVYAKLGSPVEKEKNGELNEMPALPELGSIETTKVVKPVLPAILDDEDLLDDNVDNESDVITILSDPPSLLDNSKKRNDETKTIGTLKTLKEFKAEEIKSEDVEVPQKDSHSSVLESLKNEPLVPNKNNEKTESAFNDEVESNIKVVKPETKLADKKVNGTNSKTSVAKIVAEKVEKKEENKIEPKQELKTPSVKSSVSSGWYAQVAATGKLDDAKALANKLKDSGFPVVIENANIRGEEYYRVLVGPEDARRYSETMVQQLKRERYLQGDPFIKLIK